MMSGCGHDVPFFSVVLQDGYVQLRILTGKVHAVDQLPTQLVGIGIWDADSHAHMWVKVLSCAQF